MKQVISRYITKILLSIIFTLSVLIYCSYSQKNKEYINKYLFTDTFKFMTFKKWYTSLTNYKDKTISPVASEPFTYYNQSKYLNGQVYKIDTNYNINAFSSGIVVFVGEKENYNNTIIIQGSDGFDIWYGNLDNINIKLYDYINKNDLLATASEELYITITKDGKYYSYEEYLKNK